MTIGNPQAYAWIILLFAMIAAVAFFANRHKVVGVLALLAMVATPVMIMLLLWAGFGPN